MSDELMYLPEAFRISDRAQLEAFVESEGFGVLLSEGTEGRPRATSLPFLWSADRRSLEGHMARANPHWRSWKTGTPVSVLFNGPHAYVSPTDYVNSPTVPTWNYASVRVDGHVELLEQASEAVGLLQRLVAQHERNREPSWSLEEAGDLVQRLVPAIVCFRVRVESIYGKYKMNQNKPDEDRANVVDALLNRDGLGDRACGAFMKSLIAGEC